MSLNVLKKLKNVLMTSVVTATALSATNVFAESPKYTGDYTIEAMINQYNAVILGQEELHEKMPEYTYAESTGNITNMTHIIGPILVEGELGPFDNGYGALNAFYQRAFGVNMYVQGRVRTTVYDATPQDGTLPTLYFGSANEDLFSYPPDYNGDGEPDYYQTQWYGTNGGTSLNHFSGSKFEIVDNYVDFNKLYTSIKEQQSKLKKGSVLEPEEVFYSGATKKALMIKYGEYYTVESLDGVDLVVLYGFDEEQDNTTVVNIIDEGDSTKSIVLPDMLIMKTSEVSDSNKEQVTLTALPSIDKETGKITAEDKVRNIIWNIPNAEYITWSLNSAFAGHIIAPQADIQFLNTNYAGCMVANSIRGERYQGSQLYFQPYGDLTLELEEEEEEPTQIVVNVEKRAESITGKLLAGAKLQLIDKDGNILDTWTSTEEAYSLDVSKLTINETYIIREVSAPEGYSLAQDLSITIKDTETIQVFTVVNVLEPEAEEPTPEDPEEPGPTIVGDAEVENPDTGDNIILYIGIVVGSLAAIIGLVVALIKMKKKKLN